MPYIERGNTKVIPFYSSMKIPAAFEAEIVNKFSMAISLKGLVVYKDIIDYEIPSNEQILDDFNNVIPNIITVKLGEVKLSGILNYILATDGLKTSPITIENLNVNSEGRTWYSVCGAIEIKDNNDNKAITVGYVNPNTDVNIDNLKIKLKSIMHTETTLSIETGERAVGVKGEFELIYEQD